MKIRELAKKIAASLTSVELAKKVATEAGITELEASSLLQDTKLEECIHNELATKLAGGSIAIAAMEGLQKKIEEGDMRAISLALSFNKAISSNTTRAISNLTVNSNNALIALDKDARNLLGKRDQTD